MSCLQVMFFEVPCWHIHTFVGHRINGESVEQIIIV